MIILVLKSLCQGFGTCFIYTSTCRGMSRAGGNFPPVKKAFPGPIPAAVLHT